MKRIGIFGGTFDPIHLGHLIIVESASEILNLDEILFVPTGIPPHKKINGLTDRETRFRMVSEAVRSNPKFKASDIEIYKETECYTIETLRELQGENNSNDKYFLLIGMDSGKDFFNWKEPHEILKLAKVVAMRRHGYDSENISTDLSVIDTPVIDISASDIRKRVRENKSIKYKVTSEVEKIIYELNLYKDR